MLMTAEDTYTDQNRRHALLNQDEERALIRRAKAGDSGAANELVRGNQRLVMKIARYYWQKNPGYDFMDLIQVGNLALLRSISKFDLERKNEFGKHNRFSTYATWWVRSFIQRHVKRPNGPVSIPLGKVDEMIAARKGRDHDPDLVAHLESIASPMRLDHPVSAAPGADVLGDLIPAEDEDPAEVAERKADFEYLRRRLALLPPGMQLAIGLKFGLDGEGERTNAEIAAAVGVTEDRARLIVCEALDFLRKSFAVNE